MSIYSSMVAELRSEKRLAIEEWRDQEKEFQQDFYKSYWAGQSSIAVV
jgi:hypothetical protein